MNAYATSFTTSLAEAASSLSTDQFVEHISRTALDHTNRNSATANRLIALGLLEKFAAVASPRTMECVAANPNTPAKTLARLSKSDNVEVRIAVAENCSTSLITLLELARSEDCDLRFSMAENANLPMQVLQILCLDDNPYVACRALQTIDMVEASKKAPLAAKVVVLGRAASTANSHKFRRFIQTLTNIARVS